MKTVKHIKAATTLLLALSLPLGAEEHFVLVDDNGFHPDSLQITAGDTVTWINDDELDLPHSIVSDLPASHTNYWDGVVFGYGDQFPWTFTNAGTFTYSDTLLNVGSGTIIVVPGTPPPPTLESPRVVGGQFLFNLSGLTVGNSHVIETSTNLTVWTALATNVATSTTMTATNPAASKARYFRVFELRLLSKAGQ